MLLLKWTTLTHISKARMTIIPQICRIYFVLFQKTIKTVFYDPTLLITLFVTFFLLYKTEHM